MKKNDYKTNNDMYSTTYSSSAKKPLSSLERKQYFMNSMTDFDFINKIGTNEYQQVLPSNIDIFNHLRKQINEIGNENIKKNALIILDHIITSIIYKNNQKYLSNVFTEPELSYFQDSSVIIEWIFKMFRVGFAIDPNLNESSMYMIADDADNETFKMESKKIKMSEIDTDINRILDYVTRNA